MELPSIKIDLTDFTLLVRDMQESLQNLDLEPIRKVVREIDEAAKGIVLNFDRLK